MSKRLYVRGHIYTNVAKGKALCNEMRPLMRQGNLLAWAVYTTARHTLRSGRGLKAFNTVLPGYIASALSEMEICNG